MKEENITRVTLDPNNPTKGETDWARVDAMTEREVHEAALSDPDAQPTTEEDLKQFKRVVDVRGIREGLNLTQSQFAEMYRLSVRTLQEWEQRRRIPDATATAFLTAIANDPEGVKRALSKEHHP